ncbi:MULTISPECIES: hypothetical protein [Vibrio harveyi group]|uniref:hypothetical protein n=1 Tax=Vibrio harveyi group TaxID=717610 RepID=UPI00059712AA|nr:MULTISPECIES: hypothetical protein [Vibrio harveyi group]
MAKLTHAIIAASLLLPTTSFAAPDHKNVELKTHWNESNDSTVLVHKKEWAPVLTLSGNKNGLYIENSNKSATAIKMKSGNASLAINPSYSAAGVPNFKNNVGFSNETAAAVFTVSGAKLAKDQNYYVAFDVKSQRILWLDHNGNVVGETAKTNY